MKNRIKNLTPSKIKRISAIITTIMVLAYLLIGFNLKPLSIYSLILILPAFILGSAVAVLSYYLFLHLAGLSDYIEEAEAIKFLSKDTFTELSFIFNSRNYETKMFSAILSAEVCRFYAKLIENNDILLIVKDNNDNEVYSAIMPNYAYFIKHFKPKKNQESTKKELPCW